MDVPFHYRDSFNDADWNESGNYLKNKEFLFRKV